MATKTSLPPIYLYSQSPIATEASCVEKFEQSLNKYGIPLSQIIKVDTSYLHRELQKNTPEATLIIPGGSTVFLMSALSKSVESIQTVVGKGWNFLGSCSGGNYACSQMSVDLKGSLTPDLETFTHLPLLHLLPIHAHAPAYPITKTRLEGADNRRLIKVHSARSQSEIEVTWLEGSTFQPTPNATGLELEAFYTDLPNMPACAYSGFYGKGQVVISAVHPEFSEDTKPLNELLTQFFDLTISKQ